MIGLFDDLTVCTPLPRYLPFPKFLLDAQLSPSRYRSQKPLIVTTNLPLNEIRHPQDTAHARIYDRLLEMCVPICFTGENFRRQAAAQKMAKMQALMKGAAQ